MCILADCGSLKMAYLLLKSVWKICSFALQAIENPQWGKNRKTLSPSPLLQALVCLFMLQWDK